MEPVERIILKYFTFSTVLYDAIRETDTSKILPEVYICRLWTARP